VKRQKRRERLALQQAKASEPIDEVATRDDTDIATVQQYQSSHSRAEKVNNVVSDDPDTFKDTVHVPDKRRDLLSDTVDSISLSCALQRSTVDADSGLDPTAQPFRSSH